MYELVGTLGVGGGGFKLQTSISPSVDQRAYIDYSPRVLVVVLRTIGNRHNLPRRQRQRLLFV